MIKLSFRDVLADYDHNADLKKLKDYMKSKGIAYRVNPFAPPQYAHFDYGSYDYPGLTLVMSQDFHDLPPERKIPIIAHELGHHRLDRQKWPEALSDALIDNYGHQELFPRGAYISDNHPDDDDEISRYRSFYNYERGIGDFVMPIEHAAWHEGKRLLRELGIPILPHYESTMQWALGTHKDAVQYPIKNDPGKIMKDYYQKKW